MKYDKLSIFLLVVFAIIVFFVIRKYRLQSTENFVVYDNLDSCYGRSENSCIDSPNCAWTIDDDYNGSCQPAYNWGSPWFNGAWDDWYPFGNWDTSSSYFVPWRWWGNRNRWHGNRWPNHGKWRGNWGNRGGGAWNRGGWSGNNMRRFGNAGTRVSGISSPSGTRISTGGMRTGGSRMGGSRMGGSRMGGSRMSGGGGRGGRR